MQFSRPRISKNFYFLQSSTKQCSLKRSREFIWKQNIKIITSNCSNLSDADSNSDVQQFLVNKTQQISFDVTSIFKIVSYFNIKAQKSSLHKNIAVRPNIYKKLENLSNIYIIFLRKSQIYKQNQQRMQIYNFYLTFLSMYEFVNKLKHYDNNNQLSLQSEQRKKEISEYTIMNQKSSNGSLTSLYSSSNTKPTNQNPQSSHHDPTNSNYSTSITKTHNPSKSSKKNNEQSNTTNKSFQKTNKYINTNTNTNTSYIVHQEFKYNKFGKKSRLRDITLVSESNSNLCVGNNENERSEKDGLSTRSRKENKSSGRSQLEKENRSHRCIGGTNHMRQDRPHQSENFKYNLLPKSLAQTHRKLYTFCNQPKSSQLTHPSEPSHKKSPNPNQTQTSTNPTHHQDPLQPYQQFSKTFDNDNLPKNMHINKQLSSIQIYDEWQSYGHEISHDGSHTILVKQDQLKRFTHKFAREKIQFEEVIMGLREELRECGEVRRGLEVEKRDLVECLEYKEEKIRKMEEAIRKMEEAVKQTEDKIQEITQKLLQQRSQHQKYCEQLQKQLQVKQAQIKNLSKLLQIKNSNYALSNLPHTKSYSVQSSLQGQSYQQQQSTTPYTHMHILRQQQVCGQQCMKIRRMMMNKENRQVQLNNLVTFYKIENQYVKRQLQLEKQANIALKDQLGKLKQEINSLYSVRDQKIGNLELEKQIAELMQCNASLQHDKQTLQRSLQVSSQMIINLKKQSTGYKHQLHNQTQPHTHISSQHFQTVIFNLMRQQLQLQDKLHTQQKQLHTKVNLKYSKIQKQLKKQDKQMNSRVNVQSRKVQQSTLMPVCLQLGKNKREINLQENLQRLYEQGYQSVKRKHGQGKENRVKYSGDSGYRKFYTQTSMSDEFMDSDHSQTKKQRTKTQYSPKS